MSKRTIRIQQEHVRISDPHVTSDNAERLSILGNVFDPLMRVREDGSFAPALAEAWTLSEDARSWEFVLRDDVFFHDGSRLVPEDVVFSLCRIRDEDIPGELGTSGVIRGYLAGSEIGVGVSGRVVVRTPEPLADLADLLCEIPILSEAAVAALPDRFVGTGRYRVVEHGERVILESDDRRLKWTAEADPSRRLQAVLAGEADVAAKLLPQHGRQPGVRVERSTTSVCATFMCNFDRDLARLAPFRRALNLAVDVDTLVRDVMHGAADPLNGPLTRRHLGYDPSVPVWPFDPAAARSELASAGLKGSKVTVDIPAVLPDEAPELAVRVAAYLADVGLEARVRTERDRPGYATRVRTRDIGDLACFDSSPASTYRVFREKFHSGVAGPWWLGWANPAFDALVDRARCTVSFEDRRRLYQAAYRIVRDEAPWLYLYNPVRLTAVGAGAALADWRPATGGLLLF